MGLRHPAAVSNLLICLGVALVLGACGDDGASGSNNNDEVPKDPVCGNGEVETGEQCDDGASNSDSVPDACRTGCREAYCGDAIVDAGEDCDDGLYNADLPNVACRSDCSDARCGDAILDDPEVCDDGNEDNGDGCSSTCDVERGWDCAGSPAVCTCRGHWTGAACERCVIYVNGAADPGLADGRGWDTALVTVHEGLEAAADSGAGCEVWVVAGTYFVYQDSRTDTLALADGVGLYGGFVGDETLRSQRSPSDNWTQLSGREEGVFTQQARRVYHVLTAEEVQDATVDGFWIIDGRADGLTEDERVGAGLLAQRSTVTIDNCVFDDNTAEDGGGGAFLRETPALIRDTFFMGNTTLTLDTASGLHVYDASAQLERCTFQSGNHASMVNEFANSTIIDSLFAAGGEIGLLNHYSSAEVLATVFTNNGVGILNRNSTPEIHLSTFAANLGDDVQNVASAIWITSSTFGTSGLVDLTGVGIRNELNSASTVESCVFVGKRNLTGCGAALENTDSSQCEVINCTVYASAASNSCSNPPAAIVYNLQSDAMVSTSIFWQSGSPSVGAVDGATVTVSHSVVDSTTLPQYPNADNLATDPLLAGAPDETGDDIDSITYHPFQWQTEIFTTNGSWAPGDLIGLFVRLEADSALGEIWAPIAANTANSILVWGDLTAHVRVGLAYEIFDLRLSSSSPCIDTGDDTQAPAFDIDGVPRVDVLGVGTTGTSSDRGAYEYQP